LTATRRDDLQHGTNAAYVHGCVCKECREHQRVRMAVEVETGPVARLGAKGQGISVYFRDPDGSLLEFISYDSRR
jgi:catechol 2,3-dioxygenase-like lactoylglutathione lyase family enzyme